MITGRKGSGKTQLTVKLLCSEHGFKGIYDQIIIISPTFMLQPIWARISPDGINVYLEFNPQVLQNLMNEQTANRTKKILLILDDLGEDIVRSKEGAPIFHKLIANSRHLNISIICLHQKLTQAPTYLRANADVFITFASLSTRERDALYNEISVTDRKTFSRIFATATEEQYSTFAASFKDGKLRYYKNLESEINMTSD